MKMECRNSNAHFHAVLFPFMSKGHTIPLLHLAHLLLRRGIALTIFTTPANHPFIANFLSNTKNTTIIDLPFPENIPEIPSGIESTDELPSISLFPNFALATVLMQSDFEQRLQLLSPVSFIVSDAFLWWTAESASKFGIPRLGFYGMSNYATCLSKCVAEDKLLFGAESDDELITLTQFPWIKVTRNDFEAPFTQREQQKSPYSEFVVKTIMSYSSSYGCISNSFYELEPVFAKFVNENMKPKTWCIGPLCLAGNVPKLAENEKKPSWIQWLDERLIEGKKVLYVAFGSQAEISDEQLKEIANGLEESMVNFLWVTRKIDSKLGENFEEKVRGRGIIVREWVDQMEILKHPSVEGFLSHCGWNSVIESICGGVPILAWPMMAEQPLNARMVVEEIKVGTRVETCNGSVKGFVKSEGLKKSVKELMEGEIGSEVRKNVKKFSELAMHAMEEGTGSSWNALNMLIEEICSEK